jgi:hypothetical protein
MQKNKETSHMLVDFLIIKRSFPYFLFEGFTFNLNLCNFAWFILISRGYLFEEIIPLGWVTLKLRKIVNNGGSLFRKVKWVFLD